MVRTVDDIDKDLTELQHRRQEARRNGEFDLVVVLSAAINRALDERRVADAVPDLR